jgi:translation initiation factor IF-1
MPGLSARSASKNVSRSANRKAQKNNRIVETTVYGEVEGCTFGKVAKAFGNKTFLIVNANKREHKGYIRGKMTRVNIGDVVVLGEREFETRAGTEQAIYDIIAVLDKKDVSFLVKNGAVPSWMTSSLDEEAGDDVFDYEEEEIDIDVLEEGVKEKKRGVAKKTAVVVDDDDIDIDAI